MLRNDLRCDYDWINRIDNQLLFHALEFYNDPKSKNISYEDVLKEINNIKNLVTTIPNHIPSIISDYDVKVEIDDNHQMAGLYHSLYVNDQLNRKIIIYSEWIHPVKIVELDLDLSKETIYDMHLTHECYHILEDCSSLPLVTQYHKKLEKACSEVGAHIFVAKHLNLPMHPKLVGYLIAIDKGWLSCNEFVNMMENNISKLTKKGVAIDDLFIR